MAALVVDWLRVAGRFVARSQYSGLMRMCHAVMLCGGGFSVSKIQPWIGVSAADFVCASLAVVF